MSLDLALLIGVCIFVAALVYSSVGHGGGSGYLAVMALFGLSPQLMRPAALVLNILVATVASVAYLRRGAFSWAVLWPFAVPAVPLAFVGGRLSLPPILYQPILAAVLLYCAAQLAAPASTLGDAPTQRPARGVALGAGAGIGLLAGLTGIGGGVFLSPLLIFNRWASTRQTLGVTSVFILLNSVAGLVGRMGSLHSLPLTEVATWGPAALLGGYLGSRWGSRTTATRTVYRLLGVVLVVAAVKLVLTLGG